MSRSKLVALAALCLLPIFLASCSPSTTRSPYSGRDVTATELVSESMQADSLKELQAQETEANARAAIAAIESETRAGVEHMGLESAMAVGDFIAGQEAKAQAFAAQATIDIDRLDGERAAERSATEAALADLEAKAAQRAAAWAAVKPLASIAGALIPGAAPALGAAQQAADPFVNLWAGGATIAAVAGAWRARSNGSKAKRAQEDAETEADAHATTRRRAELIVDSFDALKHNPQWAAILESEDFTKALRKWQGTEGGALVDELQRPV